MHIDVHWLPAISVLVGGGLAIALALVRRRNRAAADAQTMPTKRSRARVIARSAVAMDPDRRLAEEQARAAEATRKLMAMLAAGDDKAE